MAELITGNVCKLKTSRFAGSAAVVGGATFSNDGALLACLMMPIRILRTNAPRQKPCQVFDAAIEAVAFSPDNTMLATFDYEGVHLWDTKAWGADW